MHTMLTNHEFFEYTFEKNNNVDTYTEFKTAECKPSDKIPNLSNTASEASFVFVPLIRFVCNPSLVNIFMAGIQFKNMADFCSFYQEINYLDES